MPVRSKWLFILLGNDSIGKTTVQKRLVALLNGAVYRRLPSNGTYDITNGHFTRKFRRVFIAGRSYQEFPGYRNIEDYFRQTLDQAGTDVDLAFMASHLDLRDVRDMIRQTHRRFWNVCAIFFSNSIAADGADNAQISRAFSWDERWYAANPETNNGDTQEQQLSNVAAEIVQMLTERTSGW